MFTGELYRCAIYKISHVFGAFRKLRNSQKLKPLLTYLLLGLVRWLVIVLLSSLGAGESQGEAIYTIVLHSKRKRSTP